MSFKTVQDSAHVARDEWHAFLKKCIAAGMKKEDYQPVCDAFMAGLAALEDTFGQPVIPAAGTRK